MIWATVSSLSCFCWLYRASPSLAAKYIINLILVLTTWWCPCAESSLVLLEEGVCCDQFSWQNSIRLWPASFCTPRQNLPVTPDVSRLLTFAFQSPDTEVICHSLLQWTTFCQTSPPWPIHLGWPHMAWFSFIELDKAVICVIRLASFLWLWFQCVCPLMPSHNTCHLTWVSLTLDLGYLFMAAPAKCSRCSLPWMRGISSPPPLLTLNMD